MNYELIISPGLIWLEDTEVPIVGVVTFLGSISNATQELGNKDIETTATPELVVTVVRIPDAHVLRALNTTSASHR